MACVVKAKWKLAMADGFFFMHEVIVLARSPWIKIHWSDGCTACCALWLRNKQTLLLSVGIEKLSSWSCKISVSILRPWKSSQYVKRTKMRSDKKNIYTGIHKFDVARKGGLRPPFLISTFITAVPYACCCVTEARFVLRDTAVLCNPPSACVHCILSIGVWSQPCGGGAVCATAVPSALSVCRKATLARKCSLTHVSGFFEDLKNSAEAQMLLKN